MGDNSAGAIWLLLAIPVGAVFVIAIVAEIASRF